MMDMRMNNMTTVSSLLPLTHLVIDLDSILLLIVSIIVALLVLIRNHLRLSIYLPLRILATWLLQSTKEGSRVIGGAVASTVILLVARCLHLRPNILLLAFHNVLKQLHSLLHAITLLLDVMNNLLGLVPALAQGSIRLHRHLF
jgi:hypothetical protein